MSFIVLHYRLELSNNKLVLQMQEVKRRIGPTSQETLIFVYSSVV